MAETLARIEGDPERLAGIIAGAALRSGGTDAHEEMFVRILPDRVETPASAPDADQRSYCSALADHFDRLAVVADPPVHALFDVDRALDWLEWLSSGADRVTTAFEGNPATGETERLVHRTDDETVVVPCVTDWHREELSLSLPDRFDGAQFLDDDGTPVPTRAAVDAAALHRVVRATRLASDERIHRIELEPGEGLQFRAEDGAGTVANGTVPATVEGPSVAGTYGPGLGRVVTALSGPLELQTGPDRPLAVVADRESFTMRFLVAPA